MMSVVARIVLYVYSFQRGSTPSVLRVIAFAPARVSQVR